MQTQVIFKIDKKLKKKAMEKANAEGLTFALVLQLATKAFAEGTLDIQLVAEQKFNAKTRRLLRQLDKEYAEGKNLSPAFTNAKDAIAWLKA